MRILQKGIVSLEDTLLSLFLLANRPFDPNKQCEHLKKWQKEESSESLHLEMWVWRLLGSKDIERRLSHVGEGKMTLKEKFGTGYNN